MYVELWNPGKTYHIGRLVSYSDKVYRCVVPNAGETPGTGSSWDIIGLPMSEAGGVVTIATSLDVTALDIGSVPVSAIPSVKRIDIPTSQAILGGTAPAPTTVGISRGLAFDADAEEVYLHLTVPDDWDGISDLSLHVHWIPEDGTAVGDGETVIWLVSYRSVSVGVAVDAGTSVDIVATHTQSGAGVDKVLYETAFTIDHDDLDQPLTPGDHFFLVFSRDFTNDTYAADAVVTHWDLEYTP